MWEQGLPAMKPMRSFRNRAGCFASKLCSHRRQAQAGFFQDAAAHQHVVGATGLTQQIAQVLAIAVDFLATAAMDHGKQVVAPTGPARAAVAVADKRLRTQQRAQARHIGVGDIPDSHAVVAITQAIVIGHRGDAADRAFGLQTLEQVEGRFHAQPQLLGQPGPGIFEQGQAVLGQFHQPQGQWRFIQARQRLRQRLRPGNTGRHGKSPPWAGSAAPGRSGVRYATRCR